MAHGDITHFEIPVSDLEQGAAFYGAVFGWDIGEAPGYEGYPMWRAPNGISGGALTARDAEFTQPRSYVEIDSIDDALTATEQRGGRVVVPKTQISPTAWSAVIADPDGNFIGLFEGIVNA